MTRLPDWVERLTAFLDRARARPYDVVHNNCGAFALGVLEAVVGVEPVAVLAQLDLSMPGSEAGVARVLLERGDMRGLAEAYFGTPPDPAVLCARRGDIVLFKGDTGDTLGVMDAGAALAIGPTGIGHFPLSEALGFWRVG